MKKAIKGETFCETIKTYVITMKKQENTVGTDDGMGNLLNCYNSGHGVGNAVYSGDLAAQTAKAEIK